MLSFWDVFVILPSILIFALPIAYNLFFMIASYDIKLKLISAPYKYIIDIYLVIIALAFIAGLAYIGLHIPHINIKEFFSVLEISMFLMLLSYLGV
jgi:hypothetical protein